jgi:hypothetical protein
VFFAQNIPPKYTCHYLSWFVIIYSTQMIDSNGALSPRKQSTQFSIITFLTNHFYKY